MSKPRLQPVTLNYKGWFGICPVYYDDPYKNEAPLIIERHILFLPLFMFSELLFEMVMVVSSLVSPSYEPMWPMRVTGRLRKPINRTLKITHED